MNLLFASIFYPTFIARTMSSLTKRIEKALSMALGQRSRGGRLYYSDSVMPTGYDDESVSDGGERGGAMLAGRRRTKKRSASRPRARAHSRAGSIRSRRSAKSHKSGRSSSSRRSKKGGALGGLKRFQKYMDDVDRKHPEMAHRQKQKLASAIMRRHER